MVVGYVKRVVAALFLVLAIAAFFGGHYLPNLAVRLQAVPAILYLPVVAVPAFLLLTVLFGRVFCEMMCPLGILQSLANWLTHPRKGVRRVCTRLPQTKVQLAVRWTVVALVAVLFSIGCGALAYAVEPYSIFGRALTLLMPFPVLLAAILLVAAVTNGRWWCNWICPVGTLFNLFARSAPWGNRIGPGCANCRRCFPKAAVPAAEKESVAGADQSSDGVTRRDAVKGLAAVAAVEKTTDGGLAELVLPGRAPDRQRSVLPPGALSRERFARQCVGCGLCLKACPEKVIVPSRKLATFGQPELDFNGRACNLLCDQQCAKACPAGALRPLPRAQRRDIHFGRAVWHADRCLHKDGVPCTLCSRRCPLNALHVVDNAIVVDDRACVGCGLCESGCAARPEPAIVVEGLDVQRVVVPLGEGTLVAEMKTLLDQGYAVVVAREGVIRAYEKGRGVKPLMNLLDAGALENALVVDRVIGRAAAAMCVLGGVKKVHALLMSRDAAEYLRDHGIACEGETVVPEILNRDKSGRCPMELAVADLSDPTEMVRALRAKLAAFAAKKGT